MCGGAQGLGITTLEKIKAAETPDYNLRGWNNKKGYHPEVFLFRISSVLKNNIKAGGPGQKRLRITPCAGFTLIELLVVVLIIGILSAIALPQYTAAVEKSRATEALINLRHAKQAYELRQLENPSNPGSIKAEDFLELSGGVWTDAIESIGGGLPAGEKSYTQYYCTKKFRYYFNYSQVSADRCTPKADCSGCDYSYNDDDYSIFLFPSYDGSTDSCSARTDLGYKVCQGLSLKIDDDR